MIKHIGWYRYIRAKTIRINEVNQIRYTREPKSLELNPSTDIIYITANGTTHTNQPGLGKTKTARAYNHNEEKHRNRLQLTRSS